MFLSTFFVKTSAMLTLLTIEFDSKGATFSAPFSKFKTAKIAEESSTDVSLFINRLLAPFFYQFVNQRNSFGKVPANQCLNSPQRFFVRNNLQRIVIYAESYIFADFDVRGLPHFCRNDDSAAFGYFYFCC